MLDISESFVDALALEIRLRGYTVLRSDLRRWLADCGPLVAEDPCVSAWADRWLEGHRAFRESGGSIH